MLGEEVADDGTVPLGDPARSRWQLRLWWKPFVPMIWIGGGLVALCKTREPF